jgi:hypothetical protein
MSEPQYDAEDMHRYYDIVEWRDLQKQRDELLEALKELVEAGEESWRPNRPCLQVAREVIAKAEGK